MAFPDRRTTDILLTFLLFAGVCAIVYIAKRIVLIFVLAIFFAYLINPVVKFLQHHSLFFKDLRGAAVAKVYVAIVIVVAFAGYRLAPLIASNTVKVIDEIPTFLDELSNGEIATEFGAKYGWSDEQQARLRVLLVRHREEIQDLVRWADRSLPKAPQIVGWLTLIPILAIFFLRDGDHIVDAIIQLAFSEAERRRARMAADQLHIILSTYIGAQVVLCSLSLVFYATVLFLFGFPHTIELSILGSVLEFIPVIGWISTAGAIIGIGVTNHLHWISMSVLLVIWRVAQDYFNLPRIMGRRLEMHPLVVIFAVLVGADVGGILGIYLAVPLAASVHAIWGQRNDLEQAGIITPPELISPEAGVTPEIPASAVETTRN